jgi:hypothetical protein
MSNFEASAHEPNMRRSARLIGAARALRASMGYPPMFLRAASSRRAGQYHKRCMVIGDTAYRSVSLLRSNPWDFGVILAVYGLVQNVLA